MRYTRLVTVIRRGLLWLSQDISDFHNGRMVGYECGVDLGLGVSSRRQCISSQRSDDMRVFALGVLQLSTLFPRYVIHVRRDDGLQNSPQSGLSL